jgi:DNA-binding MarR family transcriptional regulator
MHERYFVTMKAPSPSRKKLSDVDSKHCEPVSPWKNLNAHGDQLRVDDFITTRVVRLGTMLRKKITQRYVTSLGLTEPQWRILSVMAESPQMSMTQLVTEAVIDKALVSRILRQLEEQGLVKLQSEPNAPRKGLQCMLSGKGRTLYEKAIPEVRRQQAAMILKMSPEERDVTYRVLKKLYALCSSEEEPKSK